MGMVKRFYEDYCEAMHPNDIASQDKLFEQLCNGEVQVSPEEAQAVMGFNYIDCREPHQLHIYYTYQALAGWMWSDRWACDPRLHQYFGGLNGYSIGGRRKNL
jgi:hypothetical protein